MRIMLDPGHGGMDIGMQNERYGQREDVINYNVCIMLGAMFTKLGHNIILIRRSYSETMGLNVRMAKILIEKPDLVISVHHNALSTKQMGAVVFAQVNNNISSILANEITSEFKNLRKNVHPVVKKFNSKKTDDYFGVLRYAGKVPCPGVITQFANINSEDVLEINSYQKQWDEAQAICNAFIKVFN